MDNNKREVKINLPLLILIVLIIIGVSLFAIKTLIIDNGANQENNSNINNSESNNSGVNNSDVNNEIVSGDENDNEQSENIENSSGSKVEENTNNESSEINNKEISEFDISFLKQENQKKNKIYSPLSIKYALKMLEEGAVGDTKTQITNVIGNKELTKYNSSENMSFANALFVRELFSSNVREDYIYTLKSKYDAEVLSDTFETPNNINKWISDKTLNLINGLLEDIEENTNYILINALGIDMEWKEKFLKVGGEGWSYEHENYRGYAPEQVSSDTFGKDNQIVSGMEIMATLNNYDIVEKLGEENIIQTVSEEYKKWAKNLNENDWEYTDVFENDLSDENIERELEAFLYGKEYEDGYKSPGYLKELDSNYGRINWSTDFSFYVNDEVKVFAKDLKEYDGTTLQYIGIMPVEAELDSYIDKVDDNEINDIINNLKELKSENFKEGVVTEIKGYIPKFDFEYELDLEEDLKQLGITDIFTEGKADLTGITVNENDYINKAMHKADIEFTQDGIKAAAVTMFGGLGAGDSFDYIYEVPVERIDLTFDKPYMFLIRDKETGEVWFTGTVYEPLAWENEPENGAEISGT